MNGEGWIKLHRKMLNWGWYTDTNTKVVFLHLLLLANYGEREFLGHKIKPGQCVISYGKLAKELGLTVQNVRTALKNLESSQEINRQVTSKFQLVTIEKWAFYQGDGEEPNRQLTADQQATNKQVTSNQQHYKNIKKDNKDNNIISSGIGNITDRSIEHVHPPTDLPSRNEINDRLAALRARIKAVNEAYGLDEYGRPKNERSRE